MNAQLVFLKGSRIGATVVLSRPEATVGRHQDADLRFDPRADLEVSARHALLFRLDDRWYVRDLGSRNGTLVNGRAIDKDTELQEGDRIEFGVGGPVAEFHPLPQIAPEATSEDSTRPPPTQPFPAQPQPLSPEPESASAREDPASTPGEPRSTPGEPRSAPEEPQVPPPEPRFVPARPADRDLKAELKRETRRLRILVLVLLLALVVVGGTAVLAVWTQRARWDRDVAVMENRIDSILAASAATSAALEGRLEGVREALTESEENLRSLRTRVASAEAEGNEGQIEELRRQLQEAQAALRRHQLAAGLDFRQIESLNRPAIAKVFVESQAGEVFTATAFAVRSDGTLVTNRHVVSRTSSAGRPRRIGVQFSDSDQVWPARVLASSTDADLALLKVDNIRGDVPTISGLNTRPDTIQPGAPVAVIGYPLGGGSPDGGPVARTTTTAGILSSMGPNLVRVSGYGAEGSSGSPILDGEGQVVAVLFGGEEDGESRTLLAVPATQVSRFMSEVLGGG